MGLMDSIFGSKEEEEDEVDFSDEFEDEQEEDEDLFEEQEDDEEEELVWDSAYAFGEDMLEADGFADMGEFIRKAMMHKVNRSPLYRDRIQHGVETMDMVTNSVERIGDLRGSRQSDPDYSQFVDEVKAARELSDELDRLDGREDEIINEVIGIANEAVGVMKERSQQPEGMVETGVEQTGEEI
jgi:hypothetical protein